jgi:hypothetical protein
MDSLTETQWKEVGRRYRALDPAARDAAVSAARDAAMSAAGYAAGYAAWDAAGDAAWDAAGVAAGYATYELMGMHTLLNDGKDLLFVPLLTVTLE